MLTHPARGQAPLLRQWEAGVRDNEQARVLEPGGRTVCRSHSNSNMLTPPGSGLHCESLSRLHGCTAFRSHSNSNILIPPGSEQGIQKEAVYVRNALERSEALLSLIDRSGRLFFTVR